MDPTTTTFDHQWVLLNTIRFGARYFPAGSLFNDQAEDVEGVRKAGGLLWPASDSVVREAAEHALKAYKRGHALDVVDAIMLDAIAQSTDGAERFTFAAFDDPNRKPSTLGTVEAVRGAADRFGRMTVAERIGELAARRQGRGRYPLGMDEPLPGLPTKPAGRAAGVTPPLADRQDPKIQGPHANAAKPFENLKGGKS